VHDHPVGTGGLSPARHAALAGVAFVVLAAVGSFIAGSPPKVNDSTETLNAFFMDHHKSLLVGAIFTSVAAPCLVWLFAGIAGALRREGQGALAALTFGTGLGAVLLATAADAIWVALVQLAWTDQPEGLKGGYEVSGFFLQKSFWFAAFAALAVSLAARRTPALPRWYEWATIVAGALFALGGIAMKPDGFFAVNGGMALVAFLALLVWVLATSFLLWQEPEPAQAPAPATTLG
jgi:hypothetical protein